MLKKKKEVRNSGKDVGKEKPLMLAGVQMGTASTQPLQKQHGDLSKSYSAGKMVQWAKSSCCASMMAETHAKAEGQLRAETHAKVEGGTEGHAKVEMAELRAETHAKVEMGN